MVDESATPLITLSRVYKKFSDTTANGLQNLSFQITQGQITALVGESGSGKSTLFHLIYGLSDPDNGEVQFKGAKVLGPSEKLVPGHPDMRMVTQHFDDLNKYAKVWENVASRLPNFDLKQKEKKTEQILNDLNILQLKDQRIADLSGGEKQRVAIARALITQPEILLMDEPFNQIDAHFRDALQEDLRTIVHRTGLTLFFVSHDPSEVIGLADYMIVLKAGKLIQEGIPMEVYEKPVNSYVAKLLARSNILVGPILTKLKINSSSEMVAVHPEWITATPDETGSFIVTRVIYRGFYKELIVSSTYSQLRLYCPGAEIWMEGMHIQVHINKWVKLSE